MRQFVDESGERWVATALEEATARHHGRWYLVLHPADSPQPRLPLPEVRWQTEATARRTLRTMGAFELRRRLAIARSRDARPAVRGTPLAP